MSTIERPKAGEVEERQALEVEVDGKKIRGLIPCSTESRDMGNWREVIEPTALRNTDLSELVATVDHAGIPVARYPTTLELEDRGDGAHWSLTPPESRADLREAIERGDLRSGSWRMVVGRDEWRGDVRHVHEIAQLKDVSVVTSGAYGDAAPVELRSKTNNTKEDQVSDESKQEERADEERSDEKEVHDREPEVRVTHEPEPALKVESRNESSAERDIGKLVHEEMRGVKVGETRALSTSTASAISGPEVSTFLFEKLRASSVAFQSGIRQITTDREKVTWPKLTADVAPTFYSEGGTFTPGDPTFATLTVEPAKIGHIVQVSNEVLDDSDPSVFEALTNNITTNIGLKLDAQIFTGGTALPGFTGMANLSGRQTAGTVTTAGTAGVTSYPAILAGVGLLRAANAPEPYALVAHPNMYTALAKLQDTTGQPIAPPPGMPETYWTTQVGTAFLYSPSQFAVVTRQDATVELDRSRLFNSDQSEVRGKLRAALLAPNQEAVVTLTTG